MDLSTHLMYLEVVRNECHLHSNNNLHALQQFGTTILTWQFWHKRPFWHDHFDTFGHGHYCWIRSFKPGVQTGTLFIFPLRSWHPANTSHISGHPRSAITLAQFSHYSGLSEHSITQTHSLQTTVHRLLVYHYEFVVAHSTEGRSRGRT